MAPASLVELTQKADPSSPEVLEKLINANAPLIQRELGKDVATGGVQKTHRTEVASQMQLCKSLTSRENQTWWDGAAILQISC